MEFLYFLKEPWPIFVRGKAFSLLICFLSRKTALYTKAAFQTWKVHYFKILNV